MFWVKVAFDTIQVKSTLVSCKVSSFKSHSLFDSYPYWSYKLYFLSIAKTVEDA